MAEQQEKRQLLEDLVKPDGVDETLLEMACLLLSGAELAAKRDYVPLAVLKQVQTNKTLQAAQVQNVVLLSLLKRQGSTRVDCHKAQTLSRRENQTQQKST